MSAKLIHLPLIYGDAGARDKFQDLVIQLIRSERPDVAGIRIVHGDGGVDAHEGSLADPNGVDVFQIKYFPKDVGDSQKAQIRESFRLEGLLYAPKNSGILEAFFPPRQRINAAVHIQGPGAIQISGPNAVNIGPGGIVIQGPVVVDESAKSAIIPSPISKRTPSAIETEVLKIVGTTKDANAQHVATRLGIGVERAKFYLDELSRYRLVNWYGNMDSSIPDRYLLTHEGRRILVEQGVFQ